MDDVYVVWCQSKIIHLITVNWATITNLYGNIIFILDIHSKPQHQCETTPFLNTLNWWKRYRNARNDGFCWQLKHLYLLRVNVGHIMLSCGKILMFYGMRYSRTNSIESFFTFTLYPYLLEDNWSHRGCLESDYWLNVEWLRWTLPSDWICCVNSVSPANPHTVCLCIGWYSPLCWSQPNSTMMCFLPTTTSPASAELHCRIWMSWSSTSSRW